MHDSWVTTVGTKENSRCSVGASQHPTYRASRSATQTQTGWGTGHIVTGANQVFLYTNEEQMHRECFGQERVTGEDPRERMPNGRIHPGRIQKILFSKDDPSE